MQRPLKLKQRNCKARNFFFAQTTIYRLGSEDKDAHAFGVDFRLRGGVLPACPVRIEGFFCLRRERNMSDGKDIRFCFEVGFVFMGQGKQSARKVDGEYYALTDKE